MNHKSTTALLAVALSLAASAVAGPSTAYFAFSPSAAKSPVLTKSQPAAPTIAAVAPAPEQKIFLVWRGAPKSLSAGLTYVDAAGHELSKSRKLALEKATANAIAAAEQEQTAKKAAHIGQ